VLHLMRWPDEVRDPSELLPPPVEVTDAEIEGALELMDSMSREDLEGPDFRNAYTEALEEIIEAKREHREPPQVREEEAEPGTVLDLMTALNESVARAKASRGEGGEAQVHEMPAPKKKTAAKQSAKKTTAKTAAKKSVAKKTPGRRPRTA
jgi:DNA end-binding protein Ku